MPASFLFGLTALVAVASLLLGGGTRAGFLSDTILQLLATPLLIAAIWRLLDLPSDRRPRWILASCGAVALLPMLQLVPLPPAVWTALPQRELALEAFGLIDHPVPWAPISVAPAMTRSSLLSLVPPLAVFLATLSLDRSERRRLALLLLPIGVLSALIGLVQVAQGADSPLRFFAETNPTEAVGFFANRNHLASLLYCLILVAAAWVADSAITAGNSRSGTKFDTGSFIAILAGVTTIIILLSGQAMARSRAGIGLTLLALTGAFALAYSDRRKNTSDISTYKLLLGAIALAVAVSLQFVVYRILDRFGEDALEDARWVIARRTLEAALAYFPFGAGFGTFVPVYATFERPEDALANVYVNHAHDDFLEVWLESGAFGIALIVAFVAWWAWRTLRIWRFSRRSHVAIDEPYARAATLIVAMLLAHSFVDYPLRTSAMMTIFAFSCALMVDPLKQAEGAHEREGDARADAAHEYRTSTTYDRKAHGGDGRPRRSGRASPRERPSDPRKGRLNMPCRCV